MRQNHKNHAQDGETLGAHGDARRQRPAILPQLS
jgi:hypothetical protein